MNRFLLITVFIFSSTLVWGKPRSSPKVAPHFTASRGEYPGYLAVEGPEPVLESPPPVDFNRLMLTPIPEGIPETVPEEGDSGTSAEHHPDARSLPSASGGHEDRITRVESTAGGEYYAPHHQVNVDSREDNPNISPEDLLFFYERGGKGTDGNKNYYIPFNVSPGDLIPQQQSTPSKATYQRSP